MRQASDGTVVLMHFRAACRSWGVVTTRTAALVPCHRVSIFQIRYNNPVDNMSRRCTNCIPVDRARRRRMADPAAWARYGYTSRSPGHCLAVLRFLSSPARVESCVFFHTSWSNPGHWILGRQFGATSDGIQLSSPLPPIRTLIVLPTWCSVYGSMAPRYPCEAMKSQARSATRPRFQCSQILRCSLSVRRRQMSRTERQRLG